MTANINEAIQKIKIVGPSNARVVSNGDSSTIEIRENGVWNPVVTGLPTKMAESIIAQATNKVILG